MIRIDTPEENIKLMKVYYDNGLKWIYADTFEEYVESYARHYTSKSWAGHYVWDMETCKTDGYIRANDTYRMSVNDYLSVIPQTKRYNRLKKLRRILNGLQELG